MIYLRRKTGFLAVAGILVFIFCLAPPAISNPLARAHAGNHFHRTDKNLPPLKLECSRDPAILQRRLMEAYKKLLAVMGTGEGGKLDTPQKRKAYEIYKFYEDCYVNAGNVSSDAERYAKSLLLSCRAHWGARETLLVEMNIQEAAPYESLDRVEISVRNVQGKEFFRAMNNRSSQCAPIPPNAFGIFPVGEKRNISISDAKSTGHNATIPVKAKYGFLIPDCKTSTKDGTLKIHWKIKANNWSLPDNRTYLFVKIVPRGKKEAPWIICCSPICDTQSVKTVDRKSATVTPLLCFKKGDCRTPDKITLVRLSRQKRKGVIKRWAGDTAFEHSYKELSKELVDIKNLPEHKIALEPGFYRFEYNDVRGNPPAGFYGRTGVFEVKGGGDMEIWVWVKSAL